MTKDVVIPGLGSSDESKEVRILHSLKEKTRTCKKAKPSSEVETNKVNVEIESPVDGLLRVINA